MAKSSDKQIKEVVRERYAARATGAAACCTPDLLDPATGAAPNIYLDTEIAGLPEEVIAASAGCGNPTALADLRPGEVVLDLGSGGGIDCFLASRAVGPEGKVLGVDMTPEMVELARKNAKRMGLTNVEFRLGEIEALPVDPSTVDVVISNCVVCLSPDKDAVFREAFRVLK
ncbi:MAG: methyltransferase domain-containing protein, partial [Chloroflexota bacterium]